ncbi:MAG: PA2779 family protein, partial [Betaproteobacteria bacterium]
MRMLLPLLLATCVAVPQAPARAGTLANEDADAARLRISATLARPEARQALEARGVPLAAAEARVRALSDAEAVELAARIDGHPAGADEGVLALLWVPVAFGGTYLAGGAGAVVLLVGAAALAGWAIGRVMARFL